MIQLVFFCKSYIVDLKRFERFWASLKRHNQENIPVYVSVPEKDLSVFRSQIDDSNQINWLTDQEIAAKSPGGTIGLYDSFDPKFSQQIIKAEVWRLIDCENYVCFDSDSVITRNIYKDDFISKEGYPYTIMHQHKFFLEQAAKKNKYKYLEYFVKESKLLKDFFGRTGLDFEFGPTPCIWSKHVWSDLYEKTLKPKKLTIWDAFNNIPIEIRWYGEALLKHKSIPLIPIEPLMKAYLYEWQYEGSKKSLIEDISKLYIGVIYQSNWEYELDYIQTKSLSSRIVRRIKRSLSQ